jgi:hypothetical protein
MRLAQPEVREFTSGIACIQSAREVRARLRALQRPEPKPLPAAQEPLPETAVVERLPVLNERVAPLLPSWKNIIVTTARFYDIPLSEFLSPRRTWDVARPRQIAMYLVKTLTDKSLSDVSRRFGRDHTTVLHAVRVVAERMERDGRLRDEIDLIKLRIQEALPDNAGEGEV